jgi:plastocyanin
MGRVKIGQAAAVIAASLAAMLAGPASASALPITIGDDNLYAPPSATQDLGAGSFDWEWGPGGVGNVEEHNVVQDAALFDSGEPTRRDPDGFSVTASAGSFPYFCEIHVGMVGEVAVAPVLGPTDAGGGPISLAWASAATTTGDGYDVRYRSGKKWKKWRKDTGKLSGKFGKKRKPVKVKGGRKYRFQVRSRSGKRRSGWSPELVVER